MLYILYVYKFIYLYHNLLYIYVYIYISISRYALTKSPKTASNLNQSKTTKENKNLTGKQLKREKENKYQSHKYKTRFIKKF